MAGTTLHAPLPQNTPKAAWRCRFPPHSKGRPSPRVATVLLKPLYFAAVTGSACDAPRRMRNAGLFTIPPMSVEKR